MCIMKKSVVDVMSYLLQVCPAWV